MDTRVKPAYDNVFAVSELLLTTLALEGLRPHPEEHREAMRLEG